MEATKSATESAVEARTRSAAIVEMFRSFEAANPVESMIACHCITLQFMLNAAMRDAGATNLDPVMSMRIRASAISISKTLHLWISKFESVHARNETRAAEARKPAALPAVTAAPPKPAPDAAKPPRPAQPTLAAAGTMAPRMSAQMATGAKEALLASAAVIAGVAPNGKMTVTAPEPAT